MTTNSVTRDRYLTAEESARYQSIRQTLDAEHSELIQRHYERNADSDRLRSLFAHDLHRLSLELKGRRILLGKNLADFPELTESDQALISSWESASSAVPTLDLIERYAAALGMRLIMAISAEPIAQ